MNSEEKEKLISGWSKQYGRPVSLAEVEEINLNLSSFFSVLLALETDLKEKGIIDESGNIRNPNYTS